MSGKERWVPVKGFEGFYEVSDHGRLKSLERTAKLGTSVRRVKAIFKAAVTVAVTGYLRYDLCREGNVEVWLAHRLVATHFIPNPLDLPQVNHLDGNKSNNLWTNLEWCDGFHNQQHALSTGLRRGARGWESGLSFKGEILVFKDGQQTDRLCGAVDMIDKGYNPAAVYKVVLGQQHTHRGKTFVRQAIS